MAAAAVIADISAIGAIAAGIVAWLAQRDSARLRAELDARDSRLRHDLARDLAGHESALRVEAEMKLRLHDRSWGLLRDLSEATHVCRAKVDNFAGADRVEASLKTLQGEWEAAATAVARFESLCAISPAEFALAPVCEAFQSAYCDLGDALRSPSQRGEFLAKSSSNIDAALVHATTAFAAWNRALWSSAQQIGALAGGTQ